MTISVGLACHQEARRKARFVDEQKITWTLRLYRQRVGSLKDQLHFLVMIAESIHDNEVVIRTDAANQVSPIVLSIW
ncbi:MAG TPA: hypothetical protein VER58_03810 [Thermoanaerobaculia bacterium]|nr:hypothetical protein [Thermoanaerobaculia bacterium]